MFKGQYEHTLDKKGRLSIPSRIREILNANYDSRLVLLVYQQCLIAYPSSEWERFEARVKELPEYNKDTRMFLRFFYSSATECSIDKLGRILIPQTMREKVRLEKEVILVGTSKNIEIWNRDLWLEAEAEASHEDIVGTIERLGL